ncbi:MAG TPA: S41 family peptidase [Rhodanobacteraceae bacterium]
MRLALPLAVTLALAAAPLAHAAPPAAPATAASSATAAKTPALNPPSLQQIRNFTHVYAAVRQAFVRPIDNKALMDAAIRGMLARIDPHSAWLDRDGMRQLSQETTGSYSGLGVVVATRNHQLVIIAPIDGSPAAKAGIQPGDTIIDVGGVPVDADDIQASVDRLRGKLGTSITLTIVHPDANVPVKVTLTRATITMTSVRIHPLVPGYIDIRVSQFQANTARQLNQQLTTWIAKHGLPKGVVLDLRSNPGGVVEAAADVADTFLDGGTIVTTRGRISSSDMRLEAHPGDLLAGAPMVVLVNRGTASAAEILTGALKDNHRALVMGQRTFGKGVVQTIIPIDADHMLKLTTARYYTPDGTSIQAEGITPDILIPDLVARTSDAPPTLVTTEADLPHHLDNANPKGIEVTEQASANALGDDAKLAQEDYAMAQALNALKALVQYKTR